MRPPRLAWAILLALLAVDLVATRRAWLSLGERLALVGVAAATLSAFALILRLFRVRLPLLISLPAVIFLCWLPQRWYPFMHTALALLSLGALASSLRGLSWRRTLVTIMVLALVATSLLRLSSNLRFVAFEQAPLSGSLLDGLARLLPAPTTTTSARRVVPRSEPSPAQLGDAHIVLITVDALRADRLSRMEQTAALSGLRFERAYAQAPSTAFSITSLLTGTPPDQLASRAERGEVLPRGCAEGLAQCQLASGPRTLAEILRERRWFTEAFYPAGLFFDGRRSLERYAKNRFGFEWTDTRTLAADALTDAVLERLTQLQKDGEPRSFLWVHYFDTHEPYRFHPGITEGTSPEARYDGEVRFIDRELGRLFAGLRHLRRPVILCVTADHGEEFGEHGGAYHNSSVYEEQVRVPLVIAAKGLSPRVVTEPTELLDVMGLLLSLAGIDPSPGTGNDAHAQVGTRRMLVRGNWKLIHDLRRDFDELYDLSADPGEQHNLFDERRDIASPLHAALDQWFNLSSPAALERTLANPRAPALDRAAAAHELGQQEASSARPTLVAALDDPDDAVRAEAALALGELGDSCAAPTLFQLLEVPERRHRAAVALGRLRDGRAVPGLIEALRDITPTLRRHAAHYLGWLGGAESVQPLIDAADDLRVRTDAYLALGRIARRLHRDQIVAFLKARLAQEPYEDARANLNEALRLAME